MSSSPNVPALVPKMQFVQLLCWSCFFFAFIAAFSDVLYGLYTAWSQSDDYSHGFAIAPLAVYVVWCKREELYSAVIERSRTGLALAVLSLLSSLIAAKAAMTTLASVSMIFFIWGAVIYLFGFSVFRICLFPLSLLFLMIPVPAQLLASLTIPLQLIVTKISVMVASAAYVPVYSEGNIIHLPTGTLEVVQACSGLRSIMSMLTLGALISYFTLKTNLLRTILFFSGIPIAIASNIFRVVLLMVSLHYFNIDLSEGTPHTVLGIAVFVVTISLFLLFRQGVVRWEK